PVERIDVLERLCPRSEVNQRQDEEIEEDVELDVLGETGERPAVVAEPLAGHEEDRDRREDEESGDARAAPPRPPPNRPARTAADRLGQDREVAKDVAVVERILNGQRNRDEEQGDDRPVVELLPVAIDVLLVDLVPDPPDPGRHFSFFRNSMAWRIRRRVISLPRTSIVSKSGGDALRPVTTRRSSMKSSL